MRGFVKRCSHMARMFSIGTSVHGRDLWVLELSTKPGLIEAKPNAKYVANMHGDEPSGRCGRPLQRCFAAQISPLWQPHHVVRVSACC